MNATGEGTGRENGAAGSPSPRRCQCQVSQAVSSFLFERGAVGFPDDRLQRFYVDSEGLTPMVTLIRIATPLLVMGAETAVVMRVASCFASGMFS